MNLPPPERWRELSPLLDSLLDLPAPERQARLEGLRADTPDLVDALAALLAHHDQAQAADFLTGTAPGELGMDADASLAGQRLGAYVLQAALGQGGGGSVWRAVREDGRYAGAVAIKLLHLSLVGRAGAVSVPRTPSLRRCRRCADGRYAAEATVVGSTTMALAGRQLCGSSCARSRSFSVGRRSKTSLR